MSSVPEREYLAHKGTILFVSYFFPPGSAVGGKRIVKMEKYFRDHGYQTAVVAEHPRNAHDHRRLTLPDDEITKRAVFTKSIRNRIKGSVPISHDSNEPRNDEASESKQWVRRIGKRMGKYAREMRDVLIFPDSQNLWILPAVLAAANIIRKRGVSYLLTSSPPHSCHVVGLILKGLFPDLHWIADFRDPWIYRKPSGGLVSWAAGKLFSDVMLKADTITATTQPMIGLFEQLSGTTLGEKAMLLPNGVEMDLFDHIVPIKVSERKMVIGHFGDMDYDHRNPEPLLMALSDLLKDGVISGRELEVHFWGQSGRWKGRSLNDIVRELGLEAMVFGHGQVPHKESLARIKGIDVLLLLAENQPLQIPAKTYEYLLAEKPLIAFVDEGGATHLLLKRFDNVHCVSKQRKQELRGLIESISSGHISSVDREWSNQRNRNTGELSFAYHLKNLLRKMEQSNGQAS